MSIADFFGVETSHRNKKTNKQQQKNKMEKTGTKHKQTKKSGKV